MRPRQEGIVLLVVMFVLLMATTGATLALSASRVVLGASGNYRLATQTRYLAEATLQAGIAFTETANAWRQQPGDAPGTLKIFQNFGQLDLDSQLSSKNINSLMLRGQLTGAEVPVWEAPSATNAQTGTMGPISPWTPANAYASGRQDLIVHVLDCRTLPDSTAGAASSAGGSAAAPAPPRKLCLVEAHARSEASTADVRTWAVPGETGSYSQVIQSVERSAVGSIIMEGD